jgi:hypothetical protein
VGFAAVIGMHENDGREGSRDAPGGTDDRASRALPVTAEVGGEGGSYADPTLQVATFRGPAADIDLPAGVASVAGDAIGFQEVAAGGVGASPDPADGMIRYPSQDPASAPGSSPPSRPTGADPASRPSLDAVRGLNWRGGVLGAVAGLAGAALAGGLSRRRRRAR